MRSSAADSSKIDEIISQLQVGNENALWGPEVMKIAVAAQQEQRNKMGQPFNCFVLSRPTSLYINPGDELIEFLAHLKNNIHKFSDQTRFQLAVYIEEKQHWIALDVVITNNKLQILCLDAANNPTARHTMDIIEHQFPNSAIYTLNPDHLPGSDPRKQRTRIIQSDDYNCSRMTLEHISLLAKTNLIEKLHATHPSGKKISPADMLAMAPEIYRSTQSWATLDSFGKEKLQHIVTKGGHTLKEYADDHSAEMQTKEGIKKVNKAIISQKTKLERSIVDFCQRHSEQQVTALINEHSKQWKTFIALNDNERQKFMSEQLSHPFKTALMSNIDKLISHYQSRMDIELKRYEALGNVDNIRRENAKMMFEEGQKKLTEDKEKLLILKGEIEQIPQSATLQHAQAFFQQLLGLDIPNEARKIILTLQENYLGKPEIKSTAEIFQVLDSKPSTPSHVEVLTVEKATPSVPKKIEADIQENKVELPSVGGPSRR